MRTPAHGKYASHYDSRLTHNPGGGRQGLKSECHEAKPSMPCPLRDVSTLNYRVLHNLAWFCAIVPSVLSGRPTVLRNPEPIRGFDIHYLQAWHDRR